MLKDGPKIYRLARFQLLRVLPFFQVYVFCALSGVTMETGNVLNLELVLQS